MIANGDMLRLAPGPAEVVAQVPAGRLLVDGESLVPEGGQALQARRRIMFNGLINVTMVIDADGDSLAPAKLSNHGAFDALIEPDLPAALEAAAERTLDKLSRQRRRDDDAVAEAVRVAVRRAARAATGRRPLVKVELVRLDYQVKERKVS
jgi:ribonuclease J